MSSHFLAWIILIPLLSALLLGVLYLLSISVKKLPNKVFTLFAISAPLISFLIGLLYFIQLYHGSDVFIYEPYTWLDINGHSISMGFLGDKLSIFMVMFITFIGLMIHIYASGYMKDDEGYGKFFSYFNLFMASMLLLVLGDSPIIMFIGWEGVGLCSYLLISFYFTEPLNVVAGNKAFIANRVGDLGFIIGLIVLFFYAGQLGFNYAALEDYIPLVPVPVLTFIGVMLFIGAMGKSAQIPLYVWLPDAMAGPTPVSALIHAATMVTAGVYMVARFHFLYDLIPDVGVFIAYIGAATALFAAVIATKQTDIKKILAYSTMSQLGYMFIAVGLGAYSSGLFHVFTHAFFKALLFMGAGAVIVALHHEQNIFKMGGLRQRLPLIYIVMLVANLAISGIPPFAGFFSKDEILLKAYEHHQYLIYGIGLFTAGLTSYYMFRLFFVTFEGKNYTHQHMHPLTWSMKAPLIVLALGATFAGFAGLPEIFGGSNQIDAWLEAWSGAAMSVSHQQELILMASSVIVGLAGIFVAYIKFYRYDFTQSVEYTGLIYNKFYIDEIIDFLIVKRLRQFSSFVAFTFDDGIIDGIVMGLSHGFINLGRRVGRLQCANTRAYAFFMLLGLSSFSLYLIYVLG
ncbi:NADH-quinone oxidoreductase subunit L [Sulfurospirillum sp. 1612]|uniref:NADH-quinone oxidoreductase subunit L n=1 Tax=Sulfurospirillum sp. 1612 TaxID=3094835 RepID=UPI002F949E50